MAVVEYREYHDDTRVVLIRSEEGTIERPYTAEENAKADATAVLTTNEKTLKTDAETAIATLTTSVTALQTIVAKTNATIGPADTKDVARETRTVARQVIRLTRLLLERFESTDVGPA